VDLNRAALVPVGSRTHWEVGGPPPAPGEELRAPAGVVEYEPADMTITVGAGTTFAELDRVLAEHSQECALDPRDAQASVGGTLACGLSGIRRLRHGPVRDHVLEVQFVTGDGRLVKGGGRTVKNVTGYDLPRLFVGSFGTLGVLQQVTLRCRPRPTCARWFAVQASDQFYRPSARLVNGAGEHVLLEGTEADVVAQAGDRPACDAPPTLPDGAHRGRISVEPRYVRDAATGVATAGLAWCAEIGVGTIHVATDDAARLARARSVAHEWKGWMLREEGGAPDDDGFGRTLPNRDVMRRIKDAFDPDGRCNPGRLPL
jgi:FAD/FMN-containing dehydrogenase